MLTSSIKRRLDVPHEPGETITIRMVSAKTLDRAREAWWRTYADVLKTLREAAGSIPESKSDDAPAADGPSLQYDKETILRAGIVGWSYEGPVNPTTIDDLDEQTRDWVFAEIIKLSVPTEASEKNSGSLSIVSSKG